MEEEVVECREVEGNHLTLVEEEVEETVDGRIDRADWNRVGRRSVAVARTWVDETEDGEEDEGRMDAWCQ